MDPLYPPGLDENRAVDDLYTASWICSENGLVQRKNFVPCSRILLLHGTKFFRCTRIDKCIVQNFSAAVGPTSAVYKIFPLQ